jgi:RHS repeat-associated protein
MAFRDINNPTAGQSDLNRHGALVSWTFPTGVIITLTYGGQNVTNSPSLTSVSNNLGAALTFTHSANPTPENLSACESSAAGIAYGGGQREAQQQCYELGRMGGRLMSVSAGTDQISFQYQNYCPKNVNFCAFTLTEASRPGLRTRTYTYGTPTGALASASTPMEYQQVLTTVTDAGVSTPRARFDWRAVGGQVAPYVAEAFDAQDRKTVYYSSTFTYSSAKDAENAVVRQTYDEDGRLATSADGMGRIARATYDGPGRSRTVQSPYGDLTRFAYDPRGNLRERRQEPIADCGVGFTAEQLAWWCQTIVVTAEYDSYWNKPTKITIPATAADPVTRDWDMTYNAQGLLANQKGPSVLDALTGNNARPEWNTSYDTYGRVISTQDPTGVATTQTWSTGGAGQAACLLQTVAPGPTPITTTFGCDAVGNVTTTTVAGFTTTTTYDALRRKTGETGPAGTAIQTQWLYDANGDQFQTNQWDSTAAQWRTTLTVFSATHQPLTVTDPESDVTRTCYDLVDRPVTVIDGERRATHTVYNAAGQPTEIHRFQRAAASSCSISTELPPNAGFSETRWRRFLYNAGGLQSAEIDARGNTTQQVYDGLGRPARTIFPDVDGAGPIPAARAWTAMDQRGQAIFRKQRSGFRASVFYDAVGRDFHVREYLEANKDNQWTGRNSRASYDRAGRPIWRDVSTQTTTGGTFDDSLRRDVRTYGYTAGVLTADQWQPEGVGAGKPTLSFAYGYTDGRGNRTSVSWPVPAGQPAWTASYVFDAANRASSVSFPGAGGTQTVALTYDSLSRRNGINRPGAAADTTYTYDPDSDLASMSHAFVAGTGPGPLSFAYGHDAAGKTTSINIDQPAFEWMPSMAYARSYGVANPLNQVASEGGVAIAFNVDGNMTSDGVNTYEWTFGNRLVGANRTVPTAMTATYDYDSDDRRTRKIVNTVMTRTMWSGADEMAELDAAGNVLRRFIPDGSGAMDGRLATVENDGAPQTVYWHHTDHQGSVVATSNSAGQTVGIANYSPYGEFGGGASIPPLGSPFGYTGRQFDPETGLYQYRARYYSPRLGQFLSTDPIGTKDDPNLYLYVGLDPVNATDPTGKQTANPIAPPVQQCPTHVCAAEFVVYVDGRETGRIVVPRIQPIDDFIRAAGLIGAIGQAVWNEATDDDAGPPDDRSDENRTPAPALEGDPYSPGEVDRRRSRRRDELGAPSRDPDSPIPDQSPGSDQGGHTARGRTPHETGERNVNPNEEHSRRPKGNPSGTPR